VQKRAFEAQELELYVLNVNKTRRNLPVPAEINHRHGDKVLQNGQAKMKFLYCYCRPPSHDGRRLAGLLFFNCLSSDDHHIEKPVLCIGAGSNIHFNHKSIPEQIVIDRTRHAIIQISPCIFYHQLPSSPPNCYQTLMGLILCQVALFICNNCTTAYRRRKFTYIHHA